MRLSRCKINIIYMSEKTNTVTVPDEIIMNQIYYIRDRKVMLDNDLAKLYEVETKQLKRQVKRNIERFPEDFMFELTPEEYHFSRRQNGTLKQGTNIKHAPMVFTEQGVAMLSSVLNIKRAITLIHHEKELVSNRIIFNVGYCARVNYKLLNDFVCVATSIN